MNEHNIEKSGDEHVLQTESGEFHIDYQESKGRYVAVGQGGEEHMVSDSLVEDYSSVGEALYHRIQENQEAQSRTDEVLDEMGFTGELDAL